MLVVPDLKLGWNYFVHLITGVGVHELPKLHHFFRPFLPVRNDVSTLMPIVVNLRNGELVNK